MKKIFFRRLVLLFFIFPTINVYAQTAKLNNAFYFSAGIAMDSKGNAFVTGKNHKIIKITAAGKAELFSNNGGAGIAIDSSDNIYVADGTRIKKITSNGTVTTVAGTAVSGYKDGDISTAAFVNLENITIDNNGTIYVTDNEWSNNRGSTGYYFIRKITVQGIVTTIQDRNEGNLRLHYPRGLTCDKERNLYVCASVSHCIKKITPDGIITAVAGQCDKTIYNSVYKEGNTHTAVLTNPSGIAINKNGDIYISDDRMNRIIKVANNKVTTVAGCGKISFSGNIAGASEQGERDGKALQAMFYSPIGIAFDKSGNLYIVDGSSRNNSYIRKLSTDGTVSTFCKHLWNDKTQQYEQAD